MRPLSLILSSVALSALVTVGLLRSPLAISTEGPAVVRGQLVLTQAPPVLKHFEIGGPGLTEGDLHVFNAAVTGADGLTGTLYGQLVTVDLPDGDDLHADRLAIATFDFGEGHTVVIAGQSKYAKDAQEMRDNDPQLRSIIGGTGRFMGVDGEVVTTRNADGTYQHTLTYRVESSGR